MSEIPGVPKDESAVDPNPTQVAPLPAPDPGTEAARQRMLRAAGVEDALRITTGRLAPAPDWHNLAFWLMVVGLLLSQIQTVGVVDNATTLGKWVLVLSGFVTALQYAVARGKIRGRCNAMDRKDFGILLGIVLLGVLIAMASLG